jgi:Protein of unknown function (DUF642)
VRRGIVTIFLVVSMATFGYAGQASAATTNLVKNGTFSSPAIAAGSLEYFTYGQSFSHWRVVGAPGNVALTSTTFTQGGYSFVADGTSQSVDLTGDTNSRTGIAQTINTTVGTHYALQFAIGNVYNPGGIFGVSSSVAVVVNGTQIFVGTNSQGKGTTTQIWQTFHTSFVATSPHTTLEFLNLDPSNDTANCIDDIAVLIGSSVVPSSIATTIPTPREALLPLKSLAVNGGIAAAVAMLLTFPSQLFNTTLQQNYGDITLWWKKKLRPFRRRRRSSRVPSTGEAVSTAAEERSAFLEKRWVFVAVFLLGALANTLNDGHFGLTLSTLVTFVGVVLSLTVGLSVSFAIQTIYHTRRHGSAPRKLIAIPLGLAIAALLVGFSRLINFEPGYLYGLVCGVVFTRELPTNEKGHVAALSILAALVLSVVAWIIWIPVNAAAQRAHPFLGVVLADDLLGALFVGGLVGSFFGMIPIKGLPGWTIKEWNLWAWVAGFAISILGLFQILLRPGIAGHGHRPLVVSVILFVAFGVGSVAFHEHFERKDRATSGAATPPLKDRIKDLFGLSTPSTRAPSATRSSTPEREADA